MANSQQGTEGLIPAVHKDLNFANNGMDMEADPSQMRLHLRLPPEPTS